MSDDSFKGSGRSPIRQLTGVRIRATGSYVPEKVVTNKDLVHLGFDEEWIIQRTGVIERRYAPDEVATSDLAVAAARRCIENADVDPKEIDLLLLGTYTPDYLLPAAANIVQERLGLHCGAADVTAACAGFMYALVTGMQYVATGCSKLALVIGADINTRAMNPKDRKTWPLFGDGAGAVLLEKGEPEQGLHAYTLGSDGSGVPRLVWPMGGSKMPFDPNVEDDSLRYTNMEGRAVFKWAVRLLEDVMHDMAGYAGMTVSDVDLFLLHQANLRIIDSAIESLSLDRSKVEIHVDRYGNTSAGSIPIALDESLAAGKIERGSKIAMCGFGAGLSWGASLLEW